MKLTILLLVSCVVVVDIVQSVDVYNYLYMKDGSRVYSTTCSDFQGKYCLELAKTLFDNPTLINCTGTKDFRNMYISATEKALNIASIAYDWSPRNDLVCDYKGVVIPDTIYMEWLDSGLGGDDCGEKLQIADSTLCELFYDTR